MDAPRFESRGSFLVAGLTAHYQMPKIEGIPAQWQRFAPKIGKIPGQVGWTTYGICYNMDRSGKMDYMCGVEVSDAAAVPSELSRLQIDAQRYAVFAHRDHITKIKETWDSIFNQWLPGSGEKLVDAPQFETYGEDFNPQTGSGLVEIWIPLG